MIKGLITRAVFKLSVSTVFAGLVACAPDEICFTDNSTLVNLAFKRVTYAGTDSAFVENDTLIFYQVTALETDSLFILQDTLSRMALPVNTGVDQTTFLFETDQGDYSLEVSYHRTQRLLSAECGPEQTYDELETGATNFDSAVVEIPALTTSTQANVEVFN